MAGRGLPLSYKCVSGPILPILLQGELRQEDGESLVGGLGVRKGWSMDVNLGLPHWGPWSFLTTGIGDCLSVLPRWGGTLAHGDPRRGGGNCNDKVRMVFGKAGVAGLGSGRRGMNTGSGEGSWGLSGTQEAGLVSEQDTHKHTHTHARMCTLAGSIWSCLNVTLTVRTYNCPNPVPCS